MTRTLNGSALRLSKYAVTAAFTAAAVLAGTAGAAVAHPVEARSPQAVTSIRGGGHPVGHSHPAGVKDVKTGTTQAAAPSAPHITLTKTVKTGTKRRLSTRKVVAAGAATSIAAIGAAIAASVNSTTPAAPAAPIKVMLPVVAAPAPAAAPTATASSVTATAPAPAASPTANVAALPVLSPSPTTVTPVTIPAGAISLADGTSLQSQIDSAPAGSVFVIPAGLHRGVSVNPKANDTFVGLPGAILDGSTVMTGFTASAGAYVTGGVTAHGQVQGECESTSPACAYPEDVFVDGSLLRRVASTSALAAGTYFIDYSSKQLWLGSNPAGHLVEMATLPDAFGGQASGVTIENLTVQKYASPGQRGAIDATNASGWSLIGVAALYNHGSGIILGDHGVARNCVTSFNGEQGIGGSGADLVVDSCEIGSNNTDGYASGWQAGGSKFSLTSNLLVKNSYVHDNKGPGLWADVDNQNSTFSGNLVANNAGEGIFEEISNGVRITGNTITGNGFGGAAWAFGAGIQIASSGSAEVDHNDLSGNFNSISGTQQNRGSGPQGQRLLQNLWVHDNVVHSGGPVWVAQDTGDMGVFTSRNNRFSGNTYPATQRFSWMNQDNINEAQWNAYGQDVA